MSSHRPGGPDKGEDKACCSESVQGAAKPASGWSRVQKAIQNAPGFSPPLLAKTSAGSRAAPLSSAFLAGSMSILGSRGTTPASSLTRSSAPLMFMAGASLRRDLGKPVTDKPPRFAVSGKPPSSSGVGPDGEWKPPTLAAAYSMRRTAEPIEVATFLNQENC